MKKIFLAFPGYQVRIKKKIKAIENFEAMVAKNVLIVFLYLKKKFRNTNITITEIIDSAIMDVRLRKQIQKYANEILNLLPKKISFSCNFYY